MRRLRRSLIQKHALASLLLSHGAHAIFGSGKKPVLPGVQVTSPDEPVHFFAIGDWGAQPRTWTNGGSMHNSCSKQGASERCESGSEAWDREETAQSNVMEQMLIVAKKTPIKWVVSVGDNFYFDGVSGTSHWHWKSQFENMYSDEAFHVPFFSVLGNHDYGGDCCAKELFGGPIGNELASFFADVGNAHPTAQFDYDSEKAWQWPEKKKSRWVMPYFNWTKVLDMGPYKVQFFAIDTNYADAPKQCLKCGGCRNSGTHEAVLDLGCMPDDHENSVPEGQCVCFMSRLQKAQFDWLEQELEKSAQDESIAWRFLIGHHPWNFIPRSRGPNGLQRFLDLLTKYHVQVHFAGHVHSMRHDVLEGGSQMVMTGSSGGYQYDGGDAPAGDPLGETIWSSAFMDYGFAHMEMTKDFLTVRYINDKGELRKSLTVEAIPEYCYRPGEWGQCSNFCGDGVRNRTVDTCERTYRDGKVEAADVATCQRHRVPVPKQSEPCFLEGPPPVDFCTSCGTTESCDSCATGFSSEGTPARCTNSESALVIANFAVAAPPNDEWRKGLSPMIADALYSVTNQTFAVRILAVYPAANHSTKAAEAVVEAEVRRRLGLESFMVRASVTVAKPLDTATADDISLEAMKALKLAAESPVVFLQASDEAGATVRSMTDSHIMCPNLRLFSESDTCKTTTTTTLPVSDAAGGAGSAAGDTVGDNGDTGGGRGYWSYVFISVALVVGAAAGFYLMSMAKERTAASAQAQEMSIAMGSLAAHSQFSTSETAS